MTKAASANSKNDEAKESITIDDETFYVGDCILVKGDGVQQPFVSLAARPLQSLKWEDLALHHFKPARLFFLHIVIEPSYQTASPCILLTSRTAFIRNARR